MKSEKDIVSRTCKSKNKSKVLSSKGYLEMDSGQSTEKKEGERETTGFLFLSLPLSNS